MMRCGVKMQARILRYRCSVHSGFVTDFRQLQLNYPADGTTFFDVHTIIHHFGFMQR